MSECTIVRLEKAATIRLLHDEPAFSELFLSYLLSRNIRIEEDLADQLFNSSEKRSVKASTSVMPSDQTSAADETSPPAISGAS